MFILNISVENFIVSAHHNQMFKLI